MKRRLLCALTGALITFPAIAAMDADDAESPTANLPRQELTPKLVYQFLLAEIAGSRGQIGLASEAYIDLARTTKDPRVARRAAEIALFARRYDTALDAARLWSEADPAAGQPRKMITGLLAASGQAKELEADLTQQLAAAGKSVGAMLLQLNGAMARFPDKVAAEGMVIRLTEPYTGLSEAHFARAQAAHAAGNLPRARDELDRALALYPDWEQAALARAQMTDDAAEATRFLASYVREHPNAREARLAYARNLVGTKRFAEARQEFKALLNGNENDGDVVYAVAVLSLQLKDFDEAATQFQRLTGMDHKESGAAHLYLGQIAEERKQFDDALRWYGAVPAGPQYLQARMRMAHAYVRQGKLEEARKALRETVATNAEERAQLVIAESQLLRDAGRNGEAYEVLAGELALRPDQPDVLYEAGLMAEKAGKPDQIETHLRRLITLRPDNAHAYNALGYSLAERNERLDEAQQLIEKALQLAPEDPFILDSKGWVLFRRGDTGGALDALKKAFAMRADPEIAAHLGEVLWALGRKDEARQTWTDALKASPDNDVLATTVRKFSP